MIKQKTCHSVTTRQEQHSSAQTSLEAQITITARNKCGKEGHDLALKGSRLLNYRRMAEALTS